MGATRANRHPTTDRRAARESRRDMGRVGARRAATLVPFLLAVALLASLPPAFADGVPGTIDTVAGGGSRGDGGPATLAPVYAQRVAVDGAGNFYVADTGFHCVRKVDPNGVISTVAGSHGQGGFAGDGGPATEARLQGPNGLAIDATGALYIADSGNRLVRRVSPTGMITTVAGNGLSGYSGDGGPAVSASMRNPVGLCLDSSGNLYIADPNTHTIRRVNAAGVISTVAGTGISGFNGNGIPATGALLAAPSGVSPDGAGGLLVADSGNRRIRRITPAGTMVGVAGTGVPGTSGDGGLAVHATLGWPNDVAVDSAGNILIADRDAGTVRAVTPSGVITTKAAGLSHPTGVAAPYGGGALVAESTAFRVRHLLGAGGTATVAGNGTSSFYGEGVDALLASLHGPSDLAIDDAGNLYVADSNNHRVRRIDGAGLITTVAGSGSPGYSGDGGAASAARLYEPNGLALDAAGNLYIAERQNHRVRRVGSDGVITTIAGVGSPGFSGDGGPAAGARLHQPRDVAVDAAGNVFVSDTGNNRIRRIGVDGTITTVAGNGGGLPSGDGSGAHLLPLSSPRGIALDREGRLLIAEYGSNRIRRLDASGAIVTVAGTGLGAGGADGDLATNVGLYGPEQVACDGAGNFYVVEWLGHRVRKVDAAGVIRTMAGTGLGVHAGDGGPAVAASLAWPMGVAPAPAGDLFIAEASGGRIRRIRGAAPTTPLWIDAPEAIARECDDESGADVPVLLEVGGTVPSGARLVARDVTAGRTERTLYDQPVAAGDVGVVAHFPMGLSSVQVEVRDGSGDVRAEATFTVQVEDTTAPVLAGVAEREVELTGVLTPIHWSPLGISASDACDPNPTVALSTSSLPLGTTTVTVTATDHSGNQASDAFDVTVVDTTPPAFTVVPDPIVVECTDGTGEALVVFDLLAADLSGDVALSCAVEGDPIAVGTHTFPVGTHVVACAAEDGSGNVVETAFTVTVLDRSDPDLVLPADIVVGTDPGLPVAVVAFSVAATDDAGDVTIACDVDGVPVASGDPFPVGLTIVRCTATDEAGNVAEGSFRILVQDREAPVIAGPSAATLVTDCAGASVAVGPGDLGLAATDNVDPAPTLSCSPSVLAPGTTTVVCRAVDRDGNASERTVSVTLLRGAFELVFLKPLDATIDNRIKVGQSVPVKVSVRCAGVVQTDVTAVVDAVVALDAGGTPIAQEIDDAGTSSDGGASMRLSEDHYVHNLSTKGWTSTAGQRFRVTVRVRRAGHVDSTASVILRNR